MIFLVAGLPILGWVTGAGAWAIQRGVSELAFRKANKADDPRTKVGLLAGSMIGRGWLVAGIIIAVGLGNNDAGLSAAVLFLAVFTLQFTMTLAMRPFEVTDRSPRTVTWLKNLAPARRSRLGVGLVLLIGIILGVGDRQRRQERGVPAAERVQARPVDLDQARRRST